MTALTSPALLSSAIELSPAIKKTKKHLKYTEIYLI
jgi:hypothetical protein